ncbi:MAG: DNA replication/repair protein RecF [Dysgonomonas sp.]|nr:DNA replication/repair protein RecF [Dysgonomonas sp.]
MILERISILNYKNIEQAELTFSSKINCFLGNNGMGKTNLLDAIYYLSFCKSHNNLIDSQNIRHDSDIALIQGYYVQKDSSQDELFCSLKRRQKKQFKRNKKEYEKLSDHIGYLPLVMISPSDNELILAGSEERRKFIDVVISQFDKEYLQALIRYNKALKQRNALLKSEMQMDESLYELWEEQLGQEGEIIYQKRKAFVKDFIPIFQHYYNFICQSNEKVDLVYQSQLENGKLTDQLKQKRERDKILGYTTAGIHRDDLDMQMDGYPIKKVGSQGQNKTYVVSMKLAQFDFLKKVGTTTPILLLDDIFDKLDSSRVEQIVKLVSEDNFGQIFITDTNREHLDDILKGMNKNYHLYFVENGQVIENKANEEA